MTVSTSATLHQAQSTQRNDAAKARQARAELSQARSKERSSAARSDRAFQSRQAVEVVQERQSQYHSDSKIGATLDVKV
jgi:hypothetical protein